ncbi:LysR family transcriptional regulator [Pseudomonas lactucae]|uniref:LysR family transcriptional regulator n=1 Tax=Pseudomonas lactucae TaxID=2813360 RepID=UPI002FCD2866
MQIDLRDLRYFEKIAELGHVRKAAEQLHLSQPALSKCIRRLEDILGAPLFERAGRGIQLTAVGQVLLRQARKLNNLTEHALQEVSEFAKGETGIVRVGCGPVMAESLMPNICELAMQQMPRVRLQITLGMNYFLREQLRQGNLDLILGLVSESDDEFVMHPLMDDTVVVAASPAHPLFRKQRVVIEDLLAYRWLLPIHAVASRQWLDEAFRSRGMVLPQAQIETNTIPLLLTTVAKSLLLCFVSRHTLSFQPNTPRLEELKIDATTLQRKLGLSMMPGSSSPSVGRFVNLLSEHALQLQYDS